MEGAEKNDDEDGDGAEDTAKVDAPRRGGGEVGGGSH